MQIAYESSVKSEFAKPRLSYIPTETPALTETARESLEFVESVGYFLDPWQAYLTEQTLLETPDLQWLCTEYGYLAPRQNGKGGILTARSITDLFFLPCYDHYGRKKPRLVVYTAHQFKTAREAFIRLKEVIEGSPDLRKLMKVDRNHGIRNGAGEEGFELANGNRLRYLARSTGGSGRGLSIDTLLTDEAQEMPRPAWNALKFTQRAMPNPQRILTGTVPEPGNNDEIWTETRDRGRKLNSKTMGWSEYSPDDNDPQTRKDMLKPAELGTQVDPYYKYAVATNPAFGIRISARQIADDAEGDADAYKREVLSWWPSNSKTSAILKNWGDLHDSTSRALDPVVLGMEVAEDRSVACIVAVGVRTDGLTHVEVVDYDQGTDWICDRLLALMARWKIQVVMVDVGGPAGSLVSDLDEAGVPYKALTVRELGQSCALTYDSVAQKTLRWLNHPALNKAVTDAKWRSLGSGSKAWDRKIDTDISPLFAASLGIFGLLTGAMADKKEPKTKQVSNAMYGFR